MIDSVIHVGKSTYTVPKHASILVIVFIREPKNSITVEKQTTNKL